MSATAAGEAVVVGFLAGAPAGLAIAAWMRRRRLAKEGRIVQRRFRLVRANVWVTSIALPLEVLAGLLQPWALVLAVAQTVFTVGAWLNWAAWRREQCAARPRPDYVRIAALEHELLGIAPEPGTAAAAAIALRAGLLSVNQADPVPPPGPGAGSPTD